MTHPGVNRDAGVLAPAPSLSTALDEYDETHWIDGEVSLKLARKAEDAGRGSVCWSEDDHPYWAPMPRGKGR